MIISKDGAILVEHDEAPEVAEQRALMRNRAGGEDVFRVWVSRDEFNRASFADWLCYELSDGRIALWRKFSDAKALRKTNPAVYNALMERRLEDHVT